MSLDLEHLRDVASEATPGPWGPWSANTPFYIDAQKPAPSLSKHDSDRPTYWRVQDGIFVLEFNPKVALELLDELEASRSYGESTSNLWRKSATENADLLYKLKKAESEIERLKEIEFKYESCSK